MADEQQSEVQRWTAKRRAALVISVLRGKTTAAEAARRHGLKVAEVEEWRERFLLGAENAPTRAAERATVLDFKRDALPTASTGSGTEGRIPPVDLWTTRRLVSCLRWDMAEPSRRCWF